MKSIFGIFLFIFFLSSNEYAYSGNLTVNKITSEKIKSVFGTKDVMNSDKILLHIVNQKLNKHGKQYAIEGARISLSFGFRGSMENVQRIGIFLDGNKKPLIATISPGESIEKEPFKYRITGKADSDCYGKYNAIVILNVNNKLIGTSKSFSTFVADCAGQ